MWRSETCSEWSAETSAPTERRRACPRRPSLSSSECTAPTSARWNAGNATSLWPPWSATPGGSGRPHSNYSRSNHLRRDAHTPAHLIETTKTRNNRTHEVIPVLRQGREISDGFDEANHPGSRPAFPITARFSRSWPHSGTGMTQNYAPRVRLNPALVTSHENGDSHATSTT